MGSWESTREVFEWHEVKLGHCFSSFLSDLQTSQVHHNLINAKLKHGPFRLEHCHCHFIQNKTCKCKLIKYRILLNHSECVYWLNASTQFNRCMGVHLSRFSCMFALCKKHAKNYQLSISGNSGVGHRDKRGLSTACGLASLFSALLHVAVDIIRFALNIDSPRSLRM